MERLFTLLGGPAPEPSSWSLVGDKAQGRSFPRCSCSEGRLWPMTQAQTHSPETWNEEQVTQRSGTWAPSPGGRAVSMRLQLGRHQGVWTTECDLCHGPLCWAAAVHPSDQFCSIIWGVCLCCRPHRILQSSCECVSYPWILSINPLSLKSAWVHFCCFQGKTQLMRPLWGRRGEGTSTEGPHLVSTTH